MNEAGPYGLLCSVLQRITEANITSDRQRYLQLALVIEQCPGADGAVGLLCPEPRQVAIAAQRLP